MGLKDEVRQVNHKLIEDPRGEIDLIDSELLSLLNDRAEVVLRVGAMKTIYRLPLGDAVRERSILRRLGRENRGPFDEEAIANIFQKIIEESRRLQKRTYSDPSQGDEPVTNGE